MFLYKYRPWNQFAAQVISSREIYFPSVMRLNDPAELLHPVLFEVSTFSTGFALARSKISDKTFALCNDIHARLNHIESVFNAGYEEVANDVELGKYLKIPDKHWRNVQAVFDQADVHDAISYYLLNLMEDQVNQYDTDESIVQRLNSKLREIGVFSLSARCNCPVMWAHYAQNHQGVVLIFDSLKDHRLGSARPIEYVSERPTTTVNTLIENLYRNADAWAYEMEYRILSKSGDTTQILAAEALSGIILGARMSARDRHEAICLASQQQHLQIYEAYTLENSFSILHKRFAI